MDYEKLHRFEEAATLNQSQIKEYFELLKEAEAIEIAKKIEDAVVKVKPVKKAKGK